MTEFGEFPAKIGAVTQDVVIVGNIGSIIGLQFVPVGSLAHRICVSMKKKTTRGSGGQQEKKKKKKKKFIKNKKAKKG